MAECILFVEGSSNIANGDLRGGFGRLLEQARPRPMPKIIMCNDTAGAIRLFRLEVSKPNSAFRRILLLVDLDGPDATRAAWLATNSLTPHEAQVFFMVQKMEAWFLAQPEMLLSFYKPKLAHTLPAALPAQVPHPDQALARCTKGTIKDTYHKTRHGARLLAELRLADLQTTFPDVARLVAAL